MKTPLNKFVAAHGQTETARLVGLTQGAIWQMLRSGRNICVVKDKGTAYLEETKRLGRPVV
ncbi:MAG: Cro/Cl family transcriptional regulator [Gammaproteobacteria bacterium]|nr:MAG: Cro/Cl family transcriptional regulator [Gammaproteobacteria bacterium]